jgi:Tfp pilus assembly protein PilX
MSIFNMRYEIRDTRYEKGAVLLFTLIVMIVLTSVVGAYLDFVHSSTKSTGAQISDSQAIYLAEAGLQKAIWNLKTPVGSGGQGENWTTAGTTEYLGSDSYIMEVQRWDWALAVHNAVATANSAVVGHEANKANDGDDATYWESNGKPQVSNHKNLIITFPYALTINKVRFLAPTSDNTPRDYTWAVSDGLSYTTVATVSNNANVDVTDTFSAQSNVYYLRLSVTKSGQPSSNVRVSTAEAIGSKITVTGTVGDDSRQIEETVAIDDASHEAYGQIDWNEN